MTVKELLVDEKWDAELVVDMFDSTTAETILNTKLNTILTASTWRWLPRTSGKFLTSAIYKEFKKQDDIQQWKGWRHLWKLKVAPKIKCFLWKVFHGKLPTKDYMYRRGFGPQEACRRCKVHEESIQHVFSECGWSKEIWENKRLHQTLKLKIVQRNTVLLGQWMESKRQGSQEQEEEAANKIPYILWYIWKSRCNLVFRDQRMDTERTIELGLNAADEFKQRYPPIETTVEEKENQWKRNSYKFTTWTDATWNEESKVAGIAHVILSNEGVLCFSGSRQVEAGSSFEGEMKAILIGLEELINFGAR